MATHALNSLGGTYLQTGRDMSSQVKSSQVKSSQVKSSQVKSSQVKSMHVNNLCSISMVCLDGYLNLKVLKWKKEIELDVELVSSRDKQFDKEFERNPSPC